MSSNGELRSTQGAQDTTSEKLNILIDPDSSAPLVEMLQALPRAVSNPNRVSNTSDDEPFHSTGSANPVACIVEYWAHRPFNNLTLEARHHA